MANTRLSASIFSELMNGRVINKEVIDNDSFKLNPLFTEVMDNLVEYQKHYEMCGYHFVDTADYIYIMDRNQKDELKTDIAMKAQVLLLLIGKYLNNNNYSTHKISSLSAGLTMADISAIQSMPDTEELLERTDMKSELFANIKNILVDRYILLEKTSTQSYVLSAIGRQFFEELKPLYRTISEQSSEE